MIASVLALLVAVVNASTGGIPTTESPRPHVLRYVAGHYTEAARRARIQGTVTVDVVVGPDGAIVESTVVRSLPMGLGDNCLQATRAWRFNTSKHAQRRATLEFVFHIDPDLQATLRSSFQSPFRVHL